MFAAQFAGTFSEPEHVEMEEAITPMPSSTDSRMPKMPEAHVSRSSFLTGRFLTASILSKSQATVENLMNVPVSITRATAWATSITHSTWPAAGLMWARPTVGSSLDASSSDSSVCQACPPTPSKNSVDLAPTGRPSLGATTKTMRPSAATPAACRAQRRANSGAPSCAYDSGALENMLELLETRRNFAHYYKKKKKNIYIYIYQHVRIQPTCCGPPREQTSSPRAAPPRGAPGSRADGSPCSLSLGWDRLYLGNALKRLARPRRGS